MYNSSRITSPYLIANITAALLFTILLVHFSNSYFSYALGIFILFTLWLFFSNRHRGASFSITFHPIKNLILSILAFYATLIIASISLMDAKSLSKAIDYTLLCLPFFMLYTLRMQYMVDTGVKWGLLMGGILICIGGFYFWHVSYGNRMVSFFAHPNHFGTAIAMIIPFLLYFTYRSTKLFERVLLCSVIAVLLFCFFHTESRGAMLGLGSAAGTAIFLLAFQKRHLLNKRMLRGTICIIAFLFALGVGAVLYVNSNRTGAGKIGGERIIMLEASYHMWNDHKLLGVGLANWEDSYYSDVYHPKEGRETHLSMAHNMPVHLFATTGILGGIAYLTFLFTMLYGLYRSMDRSTDIWFSLAAMTAFLAFTIQGLVDTTIINKIPSRIFFALMGYYFASYNNIRISHN